MSFINKIMASVYKPGTIICFNEPLSYQVNLRKPLKWIISFMPLFIRKKFSTIIANERIVELPFVLKNLKSSIGSKILDVGCNESCIPLYLANLGYNVVGVDLIRYGFTHPNFTFRNEDIIKNSFPDNCFDSAIMLSTIEHIGIAAYGADKTKNGDVKAVEQIHRVLKPGGQLLLTTPFGKYGVAKTYRVYDSESIRKLVSLFKKVDMNFYKRINKRYWVRVKERELSEEDSTKTGINGVVLISVIK